jgi:hypothetical protein
MAVSRPLEPDRPRKGKSAFGDRFSKYDLVLVAIPVSLLVALPVHLTDVVSLQATLATAAVVGLPALIDAVFLNPPKTGGRGTA